MNVALILLMALGAGLLATRIGLPPLVGYLAAGFAVAELPQAQAVDYSVLTETGIALLLFTIGLKLDIRSLLRRHVWLVTSAHMSLMVVLVAAVLLLCKALGWMLVLQLDDGQVLLAAFALSFSSTVFAVKALETHGELESLHGRIAVAILVMQDIVAVVYLAVSDGKLPSPFAPLVLLLIPLRAGLIHLLHLCRHGELLVLAGFALAFAGGALFDLVGLKSNLGALYMGALLAGNAKTNELAKALLSFKEFLLVGFFLEIGHYGLPGKEAWLLVLLLSALVILKPLLYLLLLAACRLRVRTAWSAALALNHHSEFGLIVLSMAAAAGAFPKDWLVIAALALSLSFVIAALIDTHSGWLYRRLGPSLQPLERHSRLPEQYPISVGNAEILIMGMGRVGTGAYHALARQYGDVVVGIEEDVNKVQRLQSAGMRVLCGDASDRELWERIGERKVQLAILALSNQRETLDVIAILREIDFQGRIAAVAKFDDEVRELKALGVIAFNLYGEAGAGFAAHVVKQVGPPAVSTSTSQWP